MGRGAGEGSRGEPHGLQAPQRLPPAALPPHPPRIPLPPSLSSPSPLAPAPFLHSLCVLCGAGGEFRVGGEGG
eukprot:2514955-Rhodomonas_salina.1